jgi:hypothetical protein
MSEPFFIPNKCRSIINSLQSAPTAHSSAFVQLFLLLQSILWQNFMSWKMEKKKKVA